MNDQQVWSLGLSRIRALINGFPEENRSQLTALFVHYRQLKESLAAVVSEYNSTSVCHDCGGQCCQNGKYRMNVLDALALCAEQLLPSPNFVQKPLCPYGTIHGCTMGSGMRPADCVLFICDLLESKLSPQTRLLLAEQELDLRKCISVASLLTGEPLGKPLLLWAENSKNKSLQLI